MYGDIMDLLVGTTKYQSPRPRHRHNLHEITLYLQDTGSLWTSAGSFPVCGGTIAVIPPGVEHHTTPTGDLNSIYIQGNFNHILRFDQPIVLTDNEYGDGVNLAKMILRNAHENREYTSVLCDGFLHFLSKNLRFDDEVSLAVKKVVQHITDSFHDHTLDLNAVLNQSGYAEDYIRARFKSRIGMTPTAFLAQLRIRHACYLIDIYQNSIPLADIAAQCGYEDYIVFSKRFKSIMNISPREYRANL